MRIAVVAVGKLKPGPERDLCGRYFERARKLGQALGFRGFDVLEIPEGRGGRAEDRIVQEGEAIARALDSMPPPISLDAKGDLVDSAAFAQKLRSALENGRAGATFIIGGPDGLSPRVQAMSVGSIAFGRVTWPHQLVRILLAEQLYRAMTILSGHPYHRA